MLTLVTSNPAKYAPFAAELERLRLAVEPPVQPLPELQSLNFIETLTAKARAAAAMFGRPVLVDDSGLVLQAYAPFPGPLTSTILRGLGTTGLRRLLAGASPKLERYFPGLTDRVFLKVLAPHLLLPRVRP